MSASNSSPPVELATLLLQLGFAQSVVDFLSGEQGIKMVDDLKIIPMTRMTPTYTTLNTAVAAFNIRKIQSAKAVIPVMLSSSSMQTTGTTQRRGRVSAGRKGRMEEMRDGEVNINEIDPG
jgi:hypothetical protein